MSRAFALALAILLASLLALPPACAGGVQARADLDGTMAFLAQWTAAHGGEDEAPYLVEAAVAAGLDPAAWPPGAPGGALALLDGHMQEREGRPLIYLLRPAHALAVAGRLGPDGNVTQRILAEAHDGQFGTYGVLNDDIWSLIALAEIGVPPSDPRVQAAADYVLSKEDVRGAWSWIEGGTGETDMTGMAVEGLAAVGRLNASVAKRALDFIADETYPGGGVPQARPGPANCNSAVWSIRAHAAAGEPIPTQSWAFLQSLRLGDGSFRSTLEGRPDPNVLCTVEAATVLGLAVQGDWGLDGYGPDDPPAGAPGWGAGSALLAIAAAILPRVRRKDLSAH